MNASRAYLHFALVLTISLGAVASWQVYEAAERVAKSNQELIEVGIANLGAIDQFRSDLVEYERLAYELYAVIDAARFRPALAEQQQTVEARLDSLESLGMSTINVARLQDHWRHMVVVVEELSRNIARVEDLRTDWDAARAQLKTISDHRRYIDPLLEALVDVSRQQARIAEQRNRDELTFMSLLVLAYALVILGVAFAVAWLLRRLIAATESNRVLARFPAQNPMPVVTVDEKGGVRYANLAAREFVLEELGEEAGTGELISERVRENLHGSMADDERGEMLEVIGSRTLAYNWCWLSDHRIFHVYMRDVTSEKLAEIRLKRMAYEDSVTGLMNRNAMIGKLDELLQQSGGVCLALLSIERFHLVPSSLGFDSADSILRKFSQHLASGAETSIGQGTFTARVESAIFAVGWVHEAGEDDAFAKLKSLLDSLPKTICSDGTVFHASYRMGARIRAHAQPFTCGAMFSDAGTALRVAEGRNGTRCIIHDEDIRKQEQNILQVEEKLRRALDEDRGLRLVLQPKVDLQTGTIVGAEVLLRWQDPDLGNMSPDRFIPIAEQSGLIIDLGRWVCERTLDILDKWHRHPRLSCMCLAINAAAQELQVEGYADYLFERLGVARVPPERLEIEVTERVLADTTDVQSVDALGTLRKAGIGVAIDDFGTGYSSLAYLSNLPISQIKIDRRFIEDLPTNGSDLARVIVNLAAELNLVCVAEGVETAEQAEYLRRIGCTFAQGYYFARPMVLNAFESLVEQSAEVA